MPNKVFQINKLEPFPYCIAKEKNAGSASTAPASAEMSKCWVPALTPLCIVPIKISNLLICDEKKNFNSKVV
jgi:hypothetical protein